MLHNKTVRSRCTLAVATVFTVVGLGVSATACQPVTTEPAAPSAPITTARTVATPTCVVSCGGNAQADHTGPVQADLSAEAKEAAMDAAQQVMNAYTKTGSDRDQWWAALAPLLTTSFAVQAQYSQPSRVPVNTLKSGPKAVEGQVSGNQVRVSFDTNAGSWTTIMVRISATAPWLASNIGPTEELGGK